MRIKKKNCTNQALTFGHVSLKTSGIRTAMKEMANLSTRWTTTSLLLGIRLWMYATMKTSNPI